MARETVEAVVQAELNAEKIEKEAAKECEELIADARLKAERILAEMNEKALAEARENLDRAANRGDKTMLAAKAETEKEIESLKETAVSKKRAAIEMVIGNLI